MNEDKYIKVEISFDKEKRCGNNYRPHFVPVDFPNLLLGVQFDDLSEKPIKEKFISTARLLYDDVDYSTLINGTEFLIKEGGVRTVGQGRVLTVGDFDFLEYPLFLGFLQNRFSGKRKQAGDCMHRFIELASKDNGLLSFFCVYLCKVLDMLQCKNGDWTTTRSWFNEPFKNLLYSYFAPLVKEGVCDFEHKNGIAYTQGSLITMMISI